MKHERSLCRERLSQRVRSTRWRLQHRYSNSAHRDRPQVPERGFQSITTSTEIFQQTRHGGRCWSRWPEQILITAPGPEVRLDLVHNQHRHKLSHQISVRVSAIQVDSSEIRCEDPSVWTTLLTLQKALEEWDATAILARRHQKPNRRL